ncbi:MAG: YebC/PmpR family DNA-binding transcriptional regulator [Thaumarchaeota archaeon]|jgi:YebC/PmpR family DNA-binding regulatory protein|nr:YebC/PmpR family DNA-binding transcriptional regulator [Nitrososphaerota archaeon]
MSGHSKWSSIKHQKGVADVRRGKLFTKLTREIIVAVRNGGASPETNHRLRLAIQKARDSSMPSDNIERAIKRGDGTLEGATLVEIALEGYSPGGAAILVEALTDNRNRTIQDVRNIFTKSGGSLGESGSVTWLFDSKGLIIIETADQNADELALRAIDAGADDVNTEKGYIEVYTKPEELEVVRTMLEQDSAIINSAELVKVPKTTVNLDEKTTLQVLKLLDKLEELDDVQHVSSNVDFADDVLGKYKV